MKARLDVLGLRRQVKGIASLVNICRAGRRRNGHLGCDMCVRCVTQWKGKECATRNGMYGDVIIFFCVYEKDVIFLLFGHQAYRFVSWVFMVGNQMREREN